MKISFLPEFCGFLAKFTLGPVNILQHSSQKGYRKQEQVSDTGHDSLYQCVKIMFSDSEEDASVVRFVFGGPFGCCVDISPLAVEALKRKRLPEKKKTLYHVFTMSYTLTEESASTPFCTRTPSCQPSWRHLSNGCFLSVVEFSPCCLLHLRFSCQPSELISIFFCMRGVACPCCRSRGSIDVSRTPGALFLCCSNLFYLHGWRTVGGLVKWYGGSLGCNAAANVANVQVTIDTDQRSYWCWQVRTTALRWRRKWP